MTATSVSSAVGELLAVALAVHVDRFAALLDHLLQHLDDQRVVVGRGRLVRASMSRFFTAAWIRPTALRVSLSPAFMAAIWAALMSSRIMSRLIDRGGAGGLAAGA